MLDNIEPIEQAIAARAFADGSEAWGSIVLDGDLD